MDTTYIPYFAFSSNGALVTRRLLEFRKFCSLFSDETMDGRDPSVKIMKNITNNPPIKGVSVLKDMFGLLKDSVFAYQEAKVMDNISLEDDKDVKLHTMGDIPEHGLTPPMSRGTRKSYETFLHWNTFCTCKKLHEDLVQACRDHEIAVHHLRKAAQNYREINEKRANVYENLQKIADEFYTCTFVEHKIGEAASVNIHKKCTKLSNKHSLYQKKVQQAYEKLLPLYEKERNIREDILNKTEEKLRSMIVKDIRETLMEGLNNLLKVASSSRFPEELINNLESVNCDEVASDLYMSLSGTYKYPVVEESHPDRPITMTSYADKYFSVIEKVKKNSHVQGSLNCLLEEEKRREEVYVWASNKLQDKSRTEQLKLKKGTKIKQKLCSADGMLAFGWKRSFAGGTKKYGFYPTSATRLVP